MQKKMSRSPVVQMQNWLFNNQQWFCAPLGANQNDHFWSEYSEALQDATGNEPLTNLASARNEKHVESLTFSYANDVRFCRVQECEHNHSRADLHIFGR